MGRNNNYSNKRNRESVRPISIFLLCLLSFMIVVIGAVITIQTVNAESHEPAVSITETPTTVVKEESEKEEPKAKPPEDVKEPEEQKVSYSNLTAEEIEALRNNGKPKIAFTFDDGPMEFTERLLDCLEDNKVGATFFLLGTNAIHYPDTVKRMGEMGLEVQNHSYKHTKLTEENKDAFLKEIKDTSDFIKDHTGRPSNLVRLPGGAFGYRKEFLATLPFPIMNWTVDTKDWKTKNIQSTVDSIMTEVKDGAVILIHDPYLPTIEAIERVLPKLLEQGYDIVSLSDLAAIKGVELENGKVYTGF